MNTSDVNSVNREIEEGTKIVKNHKTRITTWRRTLQREKKRKGNNGGLDIWKCSIISKN